MQPGEELTALRFSDNGLHCAVGTAKGLVAVFDLRSSRPTVIKDHMYDAPIVDISFHMPPGGSTQQVVSADTHIVKVCSAPRPFVHVIHEVSMSGVTTGMAECAILQKHVHKVCRVCCDRSKLSPPHLAIFMTDCKQVLHGGYLQLCALVER